MSDIMKALRRPFHRWHDPEKAVYVKYGPSAYGMCELKICDICGKTECVMMTKIITDLGIEKMKRASDI